MSELTKDYQIVFTQIDPATAATTLLIYLLVLEDGSVIASSNYRTPIDNSVPLNDAIDQISVNLVSMGYPPLAQADVDFLTAVVTAARDNPGKAAPPSSSPV